MDTDLSLQEQYFLSGLKRGDRRVFAALFNTYYKDLVLFGGCISRNHFQVEDIVQNVFLKLWDDRAEIEIHTSLKSYLLRAVRNGCMNELYHGEVVREYQSDKGKHELEDYDTENYILYSDLSSHLEEALRKLPENQRAVFRLSRLEGVRYKEIAGRLNISERTVEVWISKALTLLRVYLKDFLPLLLFIL